ncbi:MAG: A24 family peptidase [Clostridium sp.]|nr:A24 family peptidase [Clostridium sp.]MCM1398636.1 A24 family peptidase [Clostridium sp.]MCM1459922.1 A24 family peptidase [Bacteroides sp.]
MAVIYDIKTFCIPNRLTGCGCICGMAYSTLLNGAKGILDSLCGMLCPVILFMMLYAANVIGAGDIKLFAAMGSFICYKVLYIAAASFVVAAVYGLLLGLRKGGIFACRTKIHMSVPIFVATAGCYIYSLC